MTNWRPTWRSCTTISVFERATKDQTEECNDARKLSGLRRCAAVLACGTAQAQQVNVKIGVLTDMSGLYADLSGTGSVIAAQMAIADFAKAHPDSKIKVDVVSADHQNKPDIGTNIANQWIDVDNVDVIARRAELRRRACDQPDRQGQEQGVHRFRRRRPPT